MAVCLFVGGKGQLCRVVRATPKQILRCLQTTTAFKIQGGIRSDGWFVLNHKPGKYPKTEQERIACAAKYGLRPDDYCPIPAAEGKGDYPDLGMINQKCRDPYENYTNDEYLRNWGEPVPSHFWKSCDESRGIGFTGCEKYDIQRAGLLHHTMLCIGIYFGIMIIMGFWDVGNNRGIMEKQFPFDYFRAYPYIDPQLMPVTNYWLEPADAPDAKPAKHH